MQDNRKPIPKSVLIFGAGGHMGGPLAEYLAREAPAIRLRLATHSAGKVDTLRAAFPAAEVILADYFNEASLCAAAEGMEGVFVITPGGTDERTAMTNMVSALRAADCAVHVVRQVGMQPESNLRRIPAPLDAPGSLALPVQHPIVKEIFDESGLPVTYLNCGATFIDNFFILGMEKALKQEGRLIWHNRLIPWIDPREVGEVAARLLLSDNHRHIGQFHTLNNGQDLMRFSEVAELMSEVCGRPIAYDGSKETFFATYGPIFGPMCDQLWAFFEYERENEVVWARNDFVERTLGRKPKSLREWLVEHREALFGA